MFETIKNAWKIPDLRKKLLYTLLMIVIFRFGSFIPVPFLSPDAIQGLIASGGADSLLGLSGHILRRRFQPGNDLCHEHHAVY